MRAASLSRTQAATPAKAALGPTGRLAPQPPTHLPQRSLGNQATLRLLTRQANPPGGGAGRGGMPAPVLQAKLLVGAVNDPLEQEADRAANAAMRAGGAMQAGAATQADAAIRADAPMQADAPTQAGGTAPVLSAAPAAVSRKCAACAAEEQETAGGRVQAKPAGAVPAGEAAPPIVHAVLGRPGRALDAAARGFLEPSFGRGVADIRVHDDAEAARSAAAVGARAYTVGRSIVFGAGEYRPDAPAGRWLLAHEAAHTVQQGGGTGWLARACLSNAVCNPPNAKEGSLDTFVNNTQNTPVQKSKADIRKANCAKVPPDPACTGDGHGKEATETEAFLNTASPGRLAAEFGVFVDMDMPAAWAGNTIPCTSFVPSIAAGAGKRCTFVHASMENEAKQYNAGANAIAGKDRRAWSEMTIRLLTHETEHALFATAAAGPGTEVKDPAIACDFAANQNALTELAAIISEYKPVRHKTLGLVGDKRKAELDWWFDFWIKSGGENIAGNLKAIRCNCDCGPSNAYISKMFDFASKGWTTYENYEYNTTLADPKWGLDWPVKPPASVPVNELPDVGATTDVADLPSKKP